ncbi:MAG: bifunctional riboflavin kinase/FAD synthetase [Clostridia bacterium]|nr:bifunctional riboflavin kinase/FAD synthetase [Clostridia bacterium]
MTVYDLKTMQQTEIDGKSVVALGDFDGCHIGHAGVFQNAFYTAKRQGAKSVAYIFSSGKESKRCIFTLEEKIKAIRHTGIDLVAIDDFDRVKNMSGEEFAKTVLMGELGAISASCGYNYRFGAGASCNAEDLRTFFENAGGSVQICPKIDYDGVAVSSSLIREYVEKGMVEALLPISQPYSIYAQVVKGKGLGKKMGIATINQYLPKGKVMPKKGVYITDCEIGEDVYPCVTNVGARPTTDGEGGEINIETHIIGFDKDLYFSSVRVNFYKYIREEKRFSSLEELISQIERDIDTAKEYLSYR